jgi:phosphotransferase system enzyme I (PtsP)
MMRLEANSSRQLNELARIVREVDTAPDLEHALHVLVRRTREFMGVDVCTVYFTVEDEKRHVVVATEGLSSHTIGNLECGFGKGLIGRIAESLQPLNLEQVPQELDRDFLRQTGAEPYQSFLGVPIVHKTHLQGVLVVRQRTQRRFKDADEALLITLSAQLGAAIAFAKASGEWCSLCRSGQAMPGRIEGLAGAPGLAIGQGMVVFGTSPIARIPDRAVEDIETEVDRLSAAIRDVREEMTSLDSSLAGSLSELERALFDAYGMLLDSSEIMSAVLDGIHQGNWAAGSVSRVFEAYASRFDAMPDPYLRERAGDIRALGGRLASRLLGDSAGLAFGQTATVLIGECLSAIDIGQARQGNLVGIISGDGSPLSHAAILARALGIPAVMGVAGLPLGQLNGQELVVDGTVGQAHLRLSPAMRQAFEQAITDRQRKLSTIESIRGLEAITVDGVEVDLFINAGLNIEPEVPDATGSAGIGLFRSELPFMLFERLPSEQEQLQLYRQALQAMHPLPVTLRTLDLGGDKTLPYLHDTEAHSALGQRGIRFTLERPDIFLTQLRAALRADLGLGNLRLLLPMITGLEELEQAMELIGQAVQQLKDADQPVSCPPVGVMIEVPAAVYQVGSLARRADFLSIGSNDLAQYLLASDRNKPPPSGRFDPLHPALLQALRHVMDSARHSGKSITLCGEIANQPAIALLLLGMGFNGLSINASALPAVKWAVRLISSERMRRLAEEALRCDRSVEISRLLEAMDVELGSAQSAGRSRLETSEILVDRQALSG